MATSAMSIYDVFGVTHPCQPDPLSQEKLDLDYTEVRLVTGQIVDDRRMVVDLSPRRRDKILAFLSEQGWLVPRHRANLRAIAQVHGLLLNAGTYFLWARCQFFVVQNLLHQELHRRYHQSKWYEGRTGRIAAMRRTLPRELAKRAEPLASREVADSLWRNRAKIAMPPYVTTVLRDIHQYSLSDQPWCMPIVHLVPRDPGIFSATDASKQGLGVVIDTTRTLYFLPIHPDLARLLDLPAKHPDKLDINIFEFLGLLLCFIMTHLAVSAQPSQFPPHPTLHTDCDNTSAIAWLSKMLTGSLLSQALLRFFAELSLSSPVGAAPVHIAGSLNFRPDLISRPCELYSPQLVSSLDRPFFCHISQICQRLPELESWQIFLPSQDLLLSLRLLLSSDAPCILGATTRTKDLGTLRSRRIHFCWFLAEIRVFDHVFPVVQLSLNALNHVMDMYVFHLGTGHTLCSLTIRAATVTKYAYAAAQLIVAFDDDRRDPRKDEHAKFADCFVSVKAELKRWEDIPNRWCEPYTMAMACTVASTIGLRSNSPPAVAEANGPSPSIATPSPSPHSMNEAIQKLFSSVMSPFWGPASIVFPVRTPCSTKPKPHSPISSTAPRIMVLTANTSFLLPALLCNMRTSKKRRKKQSRVIPAGESNVNQ
jgi:hypothetical protein